MSDLEEYREAVQYQKGYQRGYQDAVREISHLVADLDEKFSQLERIVGMSQNSEESKQK
jgi:hypothetical protein